jgi:type IV fimbrial biogenesis protein FimT
VSCCSTVATNNPLKPEIKHEKLSSIWENRLVVGRLEEGIGDGLILEHLDKPESQMPRPPSSSQRNLADAYNAPSVNSRLWMSSRVGGQGTRGFSLIELMLVLAIVAILASLAIPSFQNVLASARVTGAVNLLSASLDTLRNEAAGKNRIVAMCRSTAPFATTPSCDNTASANAAANDWGVGWIIYSKPQVVEVPGNFDSTTDTLIQRVVPFEASSDGVRTTITFDTLINQLAMGPQGTRLPGGAVEPVITIDHRLPSAALNVDRAKCVTINLVGRYSVRSPTGTAC